MGKDAKKCAMEALKIDAKNPKGLYRLGLAYKLNKEYDDARECIKRAIEYAPNDKNLRDEYKKLLSEKTVQEKEW